MVKMATNVMVRMERVKRVFDLEKSGRQREAGIRWNSRIVMMHEMIWRGEWVVYREKCTPDIRFKRLKWHTPSHGLYRVKLVT